MRQERAVLCGPGIACAGRERGRLGDPFHPGGAPCLAEAFYRCPSNSRALSSPLAASGAYPSASI